jgi:hypothetical protein
MFISGSCSPHAIFLAIIRKQTASFVVKKNWNMDAIPHAIEPDSISRDSGIGMRPTDGASADNPKEAVASKRKEPDTCADEIIYEVRYENTTGAHLHSRPLQRRAHDFEQSVPTQSTVM